MKKKDLSLYYYLINVVNIEIRSFNFFSKITPFNNKL